MKTCTFHFLPRISLQAYLQKCRFCWELWLTHGHLPRQTSWAAQGLSRTAWCHGLGTGMYPRKVAQGVLPKWEVVRLFDPMSPCHVEEIKLYLGERWRRKGSFVFVAELHGFQSLKKLVYSFLEGVLRLTYQKQNKKSMSEFVFNTCALPGTWASSRNSLLCGEVQGHTSLSMRLEAESEGENG